MRIGDLSAATGASTRSLRYYEEQGLLTSTRTPGGQRVYPDGRAGLADPVAAGGRAEQRDHQRRPALHQRRVAAHAMAGRPVAYGTFAGGDADRQPRPYA
ncbi:MerR family DNA-binding transcriptional regulator [Actinoplanes sp. NPDC051513]|uniref:MerR family DNA-binding transcriptional regulator n=1 Tax=Actinoplanes sp. NPDC051513 TaxID=3363908 RepID=UPI0037A86A92